MSLSRRHFALGTASCAACAVAPSIAISNLSLGSASITTVSDGYLTLPGAFIFDPMPKQELAPILRAHGLTRERLTPECNLALYRDGTNTVLFDVGSGPDFMPTAGTVLNGLSQLDLAPEDITHVVFTHAHPDHIWGLLDDFDDPVFPDATYLMGKAEWDYWWSPETVDTIGDARVAFAVGAKRRMEVIEDSVVLIEDGDEVLPGIQAVLTAGHTPGHMSFEVRQGSQAVMVLGDAIGNHHVALQRPAWASGSDQDQQMAAQTRLRLLDRIDADDLQVAGFHLPNGGLGRFERAEDGYQFVGNSI